MENFLLEFHINEIGTILDENIISFDKIWESIKEKINLATKGIETKEDAIKYVISIYNKIIHLPQKIKERTLKYVLFLLMGSFGASSFIGALPTEIQNISKELVTPYKTPSIKTPTESSESLRDFLKQEEGSASHHGEPVLKAYALGDGKITIGWGHAENKKKTKMKVGQTISRKVAEALLSKDIKWAEGALNRIINGWKQDGVKIPINQEMYDAMVSMIFNMGIGNFRNSDFIQNLKNKNIKDAKADILTTHVNYEGVKKRREREHQMFSHGVDKIVTAYAIRENIRREISKLLEA